MKRFVKIKAPPNNPDAGKLPDFRDPYNEAEIHPDRIIFSLYTNATPRSPAPYYKPSEYVPNPNQNHNLLTWHSGEGDSYDPTCFVSIDCRELFENDTGRVPWGRPGDTYRVSSWASRLRALHIKD